MPGGLFVNSGAASGNLSVGKTLRSASSGLDMIMSARQTRDSSQRVGGAMIASSQAENDTKKKLIQQ